jgi:hypothetical protein
MIKTYKCEKCSTIWQNQNGIDVYNDFAFINPPINPLISVCVGCRKTWENTAQREHRASLKNLGE